MSDQREGGIAWTDETWNPIRGCSRVSEGCRNCYAEKVAARFSGPGLPYEGLVEFGTKGARWIGTTRFVTEHLADPLRWKRPRRVFVNSMSDLFHESISNEQIAAIFGVMAAAPQHTFQVLTKRPERMREWFRWVEAELLDGGDAEVRQCIGAADRLVDRATHVTYPAWPLRNVWVGVSVENQETADERVPHLLATPAAVRWVSYEPALGPVNFDLPRCGTCGESSNCVSDDGGTPWCSEHDEECSSGHWLDFTSEDGTRANDGITWIVVGGESGSGARPFDLAWARSVVEQCRDAGTAVFVKQLGALPVEEGVDPGCVWLGRNPSSLIRLRDRKGADVSEWPADLRVREWPEVRDGE